VILDGTAANGNAASWHQASRFEANIFRTPRFRRGDSYARPASNWVAIEVTVSKGFRYCHWRCSCRATVLGDV
jgi:hypothetical protein